MKKGFKKYFMYWLLRQINFFFPTRGSIGILIMDFEGIFDVIFFIVSFTPALCGRGAAIHQYSIYAPAHNWSNSVGYAPNDGFYVDLSLPIA